MSIRELEFNKKEEMDRFELHTPYIMCFTPLTPRASHPNLKNSWLKNLTEKFIHCQLIKEVCGIFKGFTKVQFLDITDVVSKAKSKKTTNSK